LFFERNQFLEPTLNEKNLKFMRKIIYLLFIIAVISCNSNPTIQSEAPNEALASLLANYY